MKREKLKLPKSLRAIRFNSLSNINLFDQFNLWLNKYCLPDSNSFVRVTRCRKENAVSCEAPGGYSGSARLLFRKRWCLISEEPGVYFGSAGACVS